jgi:hypothetical protein
MTIRGSFIDTAGVREVSVEPDTDGIGRTNIFAIKTDDAVRLAQHKKLPFRLVESEAIDRAGKHA